MQTETLSANAVAALRFELKGWKAKNPDTRLPACRELANAGIMELVPGSDSQYRFTQAGLEQGEAILEREAERIERESSEPPDTSGLSDAAWAVLRRIAGGERIELTAENRPLFRELATARIIFLLHTFAKGDESAYRFSYWGWKQRFEILTCAEVRVGGHASGGG